MNQNALLAQLDDAEEELLGRWDVWLGKAFKTIPWADIDRLRKTGSRPAAIKNLPPLLSADTGALTVMLAQHSADMLAAGMAHGELLVRDIRDKYRRRKLADWVYTAALPVVSHTDLNSEGADRAAGMYGAMKFADLPGFDFEFGADPRAIPDKAIAAMEARALVLAGDVEAELAAQVKKIMIRYLAGATRPETESELQRALDSSRNRASLITTTESTYSYNRGRLKSFAENNVDYVQFSAVNDARTSPICRSRHGLIMRLDDPKLPGNTPPLHGRCRSVLVPVYSAYMGELITKERLDWSKTAPLPRGWKSS